MAVVRVVAAGGDANKANWRVFAVRPVAYTNDRMWKRSRPAPRGGREKRKVS